MALTIGSYDGVHRGHVALLDELRRQADRFRGETAVITFDPHPRCVVDPHGCPPALSTIDERRTLLHTHGADHVTVLRFTRELSEWSAEQFCDALVDSFRLRALVVGPGFALGHKRAGDVRFLRTYGARTGFSVVEVPPRTWRGERISSGRVREALLRGHVGMANAMLGRMYTVGGRVVTGDRIGKRLGFPTANLAPY